MATFCPRKSQGFTDLIKDEHMDTARAFISSPDVFIRTIDVTINGKLRHLITYASNEKGYALRRLHEHFSRYLQTCYRQSNSSYAYAKGKNIVSCATKHSKSNIFLKTDIHAYFDSISEERMLKRIYRLRKIKEHRNEITQIVKACFYQNRLPIGFVTSPILSDLFLVTLDRKYEKIQNITYTRYADDFIISSYGEDARKNLISCRLQLERDLDTLGLELNQKKTYIRTLNAIGDSIHVLGLNIVKTETGTNRITISDRYIRETCKAICAWLNGTNRGENSDDLFAKIYGQISFIYQCSKDSYYKLQRMTKIKCGYNGTWSAEELKETNYNVSRDL
jgi:hypothetical protein